MLGDGGRYPIQELYGHFTAQHKGHTYLLFVGAHAFERFGEVSPFWHPLDRSRSISPFKLAMNLKRRDGEGAELIPDNSAISASPRFS